MQFRKAARAKMNDEQFSIAKTIMTRIVMEKIPKAKRWSVSKEFESWIDGLSKEQFQVYLDRLRALTRTLSDNGLANQETPEETGTFIFFASCLPTEIQKKEQLARIGGEATAYYALALWRSLQVEELQKGLSINKSDAPRKRSVRRLVDIFLRYRKIGL
jgi:hypothetical protein